MDLSGPSGTGRPRATVCHIEPSRTDRGTPVSPFDEQPASRINVRLSATVQLDGVPSSTPAISVNLSETGVLLRVGRRVSRGTQVQLGFQDFEAKGEVIWTAKGDDGGHLVGVKFLSLRRRDRKSLERILRSGDL